MIIKKKSETQLNSTEFTRTKQHCNMSMKNKKKNHDTFPILCGTNGVLSRVQLCAFRLVVSAQTVESFCS